MHVLELHHGGVVHRPAHDVTKETCAPPRDSDEVDRGRLRMRGNVVEWSLANGHVLDRTLEFPHPVLDVAFVSFNGQNDDAGHSVCVLAKTDRLTVVAPSGSVMDVPLPFQATSIRAMHRGLLLERSKNPPSSGNTPVLFSLMHPLDEIKPVVVQVDASQPPDDWAFVCDPVEVLVHVHAADPPFLAFFHPHRRTFRVKAISPIAAKVGAKTASIVPEIALHQIWESPRLPASQNASSCSLFVTCSADASPGLCIFNPHSQELLLQPFERTSQTSSALAASLASPTLLRCRLACRVLRNRGTTPPSSHAVDLVVVTHTNELVLYHGALKICSLALPRQPSLGSIDEIVELRECPVVHTFEVQFSTSDHAVRVKIPLDFTCPLLDRIFDSMDAQLPPKVTLPWRAAVRSAPETDWAAFTKFLRQAAAIGTNTAKTAGPAQPSQRLGAYDELIMTASFQKLAHGQPKLFGQPRRVLASVQTSSNGDDPLVNDLSHHLPAVFSTLHALYEDLKLSTSSLPWLGPLGAVLYAVAETKGLAAYAQHYVADLGPMDIAENESDYGASGHSTAPWTALASSRPPNIYGWLQQRMAIFHYNRVHPHRTRHPPEFPTSPLYPRTQAVVALYGKLYPGFPSDDHTDDPSRVLHDVRAQAVVHHLVSIPSFDHLIDDLPDGVAVPLRYARSICTHAPGDCWDAATCQAIQRPDWVGQGRHDVAVRPAVPVRTVVADDDGFEDVFHWHAPLFPQDLRLKEVARLLRSNKIMYLKIPADPTRSDGDLVNMQQARLLLLCKRSMAMPVARGMVTFGSLAAHAATSLTSPVGFPPMPLAARIAESNAKIYLDSSTYKELTLWPQFHNGVATALRLPPARATNVTAQWIFSHKPKPTASEDHDHVAAHAGFLLGLGLLGHLNKLSQSAIFQYLSMDHELTSVGLLLGLAATAAVTQPKNLALERSATRILSLHIPSLLPPTYSHVNITPSAQTAALVGLGLVYQGTGNRNMTEIMLSEIASAPVVMSPTSSQPTVDLSQKEGYALAAGMAVGLIALGRRNDPGLADLHLEAKLVKYMLGGSHASRPVPGNCVLRTRAKSATHEYVNVDATAAGSALALAFMYMHSNNARVRDQLQIPQTVVLLEAVRPDLLFVRVVASNLVAWDDVQPSMEWIEAHQPPCLQGAVDASTAQEAYANILTGACFSMGLKYAGSHSPDAKTTLLQCIADFCEWRTKAKAVSRVTWERCLGVLAQSVGLVMAGSGDVATMQALRVVLLRQKADAMADVTYGSHMAVSSALGLLFLGGGRCSLRTAPFDIAVLVIALYPMYPSKTSDQKYHLQALRHLYVLAVDPRRFVETVDADTGLLTPVALAIVPVGHAASTAAVTVRTPHLLPAFDKLSIVSSRHFPIAVDATDTSSETANACRLRSLDRDRRIYVKRKQGNLDSPQLTLLQLFHRWFVARESHQVAMTAFCKRVWQECQMQHKPHVLSVYLNAKQTEGAVLGDSIAHSVNVATLQLMHLHMEVEAHVFQYEEHTGADQEGIAIAQLVNEDFILGYTNALFKYFADLDPDGSLSKAACAQMRFMGDPALAELE